MDVNYSLSSVSATNDPLVIDEDKQISILGTSVVSGQAQINSVKAPLMSTGRIYCSGDAYIYGKIKTPLQLESGIAFEDGTAASPSIKFSSDFSTGIYKNNDAVSTTVGGVESLRVGTAGVSILSKLTTVSGNLILDPVGDIDLMGHTLLNAGGITIQVGQPNDVIVNDGLGVLTGEAQLATTRGGTGIDSSALTGIPHITGGIWSASAIVNADISATAAIARSKIAAGSPSHVVVNDGAGALSSQATLSTALGGTGINSSALTGIPHIASGTWSASAIVNADISASAAITRSKLTTGSADYVLINDGTGAMSAEQYLSPARGGTGVSSSASTGIAKISAGSWVFAPITDGDFGTINNLTIGTLNTNTITSTGGTVNITAKTHMIPQQIPGGGTTTITVNVSTTGEVPAALLALQTATGAGAGTAYSIRANIAFGSSTDGISTGLRFFRIKVKNIGGTVSFSNLVLDGSAVDNPLDQANISAAALGTVFYINVVGINGMIIKWCGNFQIISQEF